MTEQSGRERRRPANDGPRAAARNRAALIAAAREICAEQGLEAPLSAIARRAGVGQGVLYRHFPDRASLVSAVLEENVRQVEQAAEAEDAALPGLLGVLTWHLAESAAFIGLLHADRTGDGSATTHTHPSALSDRVQHSLRTHLPPGHPLSAEDLELAVAMVSAAVVGPTREDRQRRALAAWRLLGVEVGPVRPFDG